MHRHRTDGDDEVRRPGHEEIRTENHRVAQHPQGGRTRFTCVEGPEFDGHEVDFDEAMRRQGMYRNEEQRAAAIEAEREAGHQCKIGLDK